MLADTFANRLHKAMQIRNIKQIELHELTQIDKTLINKYLSGNAKARQDKLTLIAKALDVNEAWLMGYDVPMERNYTSMDMPRQTAVVLVYGTIPAGVPMECIEDILDTEEIPANWLNGGRHFFGLKIKGDSMFPEYHDGDTLILEKVEDCENGQDAVVMVNGNDGTFKRVIKNETGIILQPLNPKFPPMVYSNEQIENLPVKIIGVAKEIRRKL